MLQWSSLWSSFFCTLRYPFILFPRATLPHRPLLPNSLGTRMLSKVGPHTWRFVLMSCLLILTFTCTKLLKLFLVVCNHIVSPVALQTYVGTKMITDALTNMHNQTKTQTQLHRKLLLACYFLAHAHTVVLCCWLKPDDPQSCHCGQWNAPSPGETECPVTHGNKMKI